MLSTGNNSDYENTEIIYTDSLDCRNVQTQNESGYVSLNNEDHSIYVGTSRQKSQTLWTQCTQNQTGYFTVQI